MNNIIEIDHLTSQRHSMFMTVGGCYKSVLTSFAVATEHEYVGDAEIREVDKLILDITSAILAADDMWHRCHTIALAKHGGYRHRAGTTSCRRQAISATIHLMVRLLRAVGRDIDVGRRKFHQSVHLAVDTLDAFSSDRGQNLKRKCRRMVGSEKLGNCHIFI